MYYIKTKLLNIKGTVHFHLIYEGLNSLEKKLFFLILYKDESIKLKFS